jgi:hypothetical protein
MFRAQVVLIRRPDDIALPLKALEYPGGRVFGAAEGSGHVLLGDGPSFLGELRYAQQELDLYPRRFEAFEDVADFLFPFFITTVR